MHHPQRLRFIPILASFALLAAATPAFAAEIHVAKSGDDTAAGSESAPLLSISAAAEKAMPGDTITVHAGVYREWVKPPRGGLSDTKRIVYQAAPGEKVVITGSEAPKGWEKVSGDVWKLSLSNKFFGGSNPFDELLYGSWYQSHGRPVHTGAVFVEGKRLDEAFSADALTKSGDDTPRWFAKADGNGGPILMNFEWIRPVGGKLANSMQGSVENGDQAVYIAETRWPFGYLKDGSILHFDGVDFGVGTDELEFQASSLAAGGKVEMHLGKTPAGPLLGVGDVVNTGDWEKFNVFKLRMQRKLSGKQDVCFALRAPAVKADGRTEIYAKLPAGTDPNSGAVEIAVRPTVFFPGKTGMNYITVRGFTLMNAATNWASPSAFQPGLIGPRWARGWVIEDNEILNSRCSGISLGRHTFGHSHHYQKNDCKIYPEPGSGETEARLRDYFDNASWNKDEAGHHIVRNNRIHDCGQAGIVGCSGAAFSLIEGNDIFHIYRGESFTGAEMAGIKLHFPVDATIRDNRIHDCGFLGLWLDWGAQGTRVTGNLFDGNDRDALVEVCHGPVLFANNLFLSPKSLWLSAQGVAIGHNLLAGDFTGGADHVFGGRRSYSYKPHDTVSNGKPGNLGGDWRWYNNLIPAGINLRGANPQPTETVSADRPVAPGDDWQWFNTPPPSGHNPLEQGAQLPVIVSGNATFNTPWQAGRRLFNIRSFTPEGGPVVTATANDGKVGTATEPCSEGGRHVSGIRPGDRLRFDAVDFGVGARSVEIRASADSGYGGRVEFRADRPDGELLGATDIPPTGGWQKWRTFKTALKPVSGKKKIFLVFTVTGVGEGVSPKGDDSSLHLPDTTEPKLVEKPDGAYLVFTTDAAWRDARHRKLVTTAVLGRAAVSKQTFENPDGSSLRLDTDYFGKKRDAANPFPGPFETPVSGEVKVWPK